MAVRLSIDVIYIHLKSSKIDENWPEIFPNLQIEQSKQRHRIFPIEPICPQ